MKISEVAQLTGVSIRTLHYYDEIGLLIPSEVLESGYRVYDEEGLMLLQQILFLKELDFSLKEIKKIIKNPSFNISDALTKQQDLLVKKKERLVGLIDLISAMLKGENRMSFKEFDCTEIEADKKKYADEIKEKWGSTEAYAEYEIKTESYDKEKWEKVKEESNQIIKEFSKIRQGNPENEQAQALVKQWQRYISKNFYDCSKEILAGLGMMYVNDQRFTKNMDKYGEGTATFFSKAIEVFCTK